MDRKEIITNEEQDIAKLFSDNNETSEVMKSFKQRSEKDKKKN